jgi:hypothetical protein
MSKKLVKDLKQNPNMQVEDIQLKFGIGYTRANIVRIKALENIQKEKELN